MKKTYRVVLHIDLENYADEQEHMEDIEIYFRHKSDEIYDSIFQKFDVISITPLLDRNLLV